MGKNTDKSLRTFVARRLRGKNQNQTRASRRTGQKKKTYDVREHALDRVSERAGEALRAKAGGPTRARVPESGTVGAITNLLDTLVSKIIFLILNNRNVFLFCYIVQKSQLKRNKFK